MSSSCDIYTRMYIYSMKVIYEYENILCVYVSL